jgi:hypothetical protein
VLQDRLKGVILRFGGPQGVRDEDPVKTVPKLETTKTGFKPMAAVVREEPQWYLVAPGIKIGCSRSQLIQALE